MIPKWFHIDSKIVQKWFQKWFKNDSKMIPKMIPKMIQKWFKNDSKMIQNDSKCSRIVSAIIKTEQNKNGIGPFQDRMKSERNGINTLLKNILRKTIFQ